MMLVMIQITYLYVGKNYSLSSNRKISELLTYLPETH